MEPPGDLMPWHSPPVFIIKSLLYPLTTVATLALALLACRQPFQKAYFLTAVLAFLATSDYFAAAPLPSPATRGASARGLFAITWRWWLVVAFLWALLSASGFESKFDSRVWISWAMINPVALWLSAVAARRGFTLAATVRRMRPRNAIIVGLNDLSLLLAKRLRGDPSLRILGHFDDRASHPQAGAALLGDTSELRQFIGRNDVGIVYITWPMTRERRILELLEVLRDSTASIYFVPDVSIVNVIQGRVALVNGMPVVGVCESPFYGIRGIPKRTLDLAVSSALLVLGAPLLLAIAVGVKLSSPGPVLFRQRRYGLDGREFLVCKFRSMTVSEDGESRFCAATRSDARVTGFGAFIRRTSLDELPQLLNVLEGSMSLVGPRPHVVAMNEAYRRVISGYMVRHKVRPGMTGWAQVNGSRGGNDLESMRRRLELDLDYLKRWSLWLDIVILIRTVPLLLTDRQAY